MTRASGTKRLHLPQKPHHGLMRCSGRKNANVEGEARNANAEESRHRLHSSPLRVRCQRRSGGSPSRGSLGSAAGPGTKDTDGACRGPAGLRDRAVGSRGIDEETCRGVRRQVCTDDEPGRCRTDGIQGRWHQSSALPQHAVAPPSENGSDDRRRFNTEAYVAARLPARDMCGRSDISRSSYSVERFTTQ